MGLREKKLIFVVREGTPILGCKAKGNVPQQIVCAPLHSVWGNKADLNFVTRLRENKSIFGAIGYY